MEKTKVNLKLKTFTIFLLIILLLSSCSKAEAPQSSEISNSPEESTNTEAQKSEDKEQFSEESLKSKETFEAVYCGVYGFGNDGINTSGKDKFKYVFKIDSEEKIFSVSNGELSSDGNYSYSIQNTLKRGYTYNITVENKKVINAEEISPVINPNDKFTPVVPASAGEKTITNLISTAMMPVGTSLYIYGGGWDWQDIGPSKEAVSIGVADSWVKFFNEQNNRFSYINSNDKENSYFPHGKWNEYYYAGLDCSGYIGWMIYNVVNTENGKEGYVMSASEMAKNFSSRGWGSFSKNIGNNPIAAMGDLLPGDIVSKSGHVWLCLGTCDDGSIVIAHSTPSDSRTGEAGGGVQIGAIGESEECEAYKLADHYMKTYFSKWYARYPASLKSFKEYTDFREGDTGIFSWYTEGEKPFLTDPDNIRSMSAEQVLSFIFKDA